MIDQYINKYGKRLYGLCRTLCANIHDADDLYQETWLGVLKNIGLAWLGSPTIAGLITYIIAFLTKGYFGA